MKKTKKTVSVLLCAAMVLAAAGCSSSGKPASKDEVKKIGIIQLMPHNALDAANQGFVDGLAEAGYVDGENITIDQQNAQGDQSNCVTIAQKLVNDGEDLILAIATPAAQAAAGATSDIPILVTAVTDPASAGLVDSNEAPGGNVTGTSDLTPIKDQIELLKRIIPDAKTVAILYSSAEDNSRYQADIAKTEIEAAGMEWVEATASQAADVQSVVESLVGKVDVIYSPTDNLIAGAMATVSMIATQNSIPCIVGEEGMVENGGLATYGLSYYNLGRLTAQQAVKILEGEAKPADLPIGYLPKEDCALAVNEDTAAALGITIPQDVLDEIAAQNK